MRKYRIHQTIEYIRSQAEFPFDAADVEEQLDVVLAYFGICQPFASNEREELIRYLVPLGVSFEVGEMARLRQRQQDYLMGVHVPIPSERALDLRCRNFLLHYGEAIRDELLALIGASVATHGGQDE